MIFVNLKGSKLRTFLHKEITVPQNILSIKETERNIHTVLPQQQSQY